MTTEKQQPAFYIFDNDENGNAKIVGRGYPHKKGNGFNLLIGGKRYTAFPPKSRTTHELPETEGA